MEIITNAHPTHIKKNVINTEAIQISGDKMESILLAPSLIKSILKGKEIIRKIVNAINLKQVRYQGELLAKFK